MSNHNKDYRGKRSDIGVADESVTDVLVNETEVDVEDGTIIPEPVYATVCNTELLNVREKPRIDSTVICVIRKEDRVLVDEPLSTDDWYKVCTENGIEGFCMKKFINVER